MKYDEIINYTDNQCKLYGLVNKKITHSKGFYLFKKDFAKVQCWAWYGEALGGCFRFDFIIYVKDATVCNKMIKNVETIVDGYDTYAQKNFRVYFAHDFKFRSANMMNLGEAMLNYLKFMKKDFPKIEKILAGL